MKAKNIWVIASIILSVAIIAVLVPSCKRPTKKIKIGIIQYMDHPLLEAVNKGFNDQLKKEGLVEGKDVEVVFQNAQANNQTNKIIIDKFVSDKVSLIFAIATPSAQAAARSTKDIPIVFGAITDPVSAGLVKSLSSSGNNMTGTSDVWPVKDQMELINVLNIKGKRIGIVFNPGESNSASNMKIVRELAKELGLQLVEATASNTSEVYTAAQSLVGRVDAIYIAADNTAMGAIESIIKVAEKNSIPVIGGDSSTVEKGALATYNTSYYQLGVESALIAKKILVDGVKPSDIPVVVSAKSDLYLNKKACDKLGVTVPDSLAKTAVKVF